MKNVEDIDLTKHSIKFIKSIENFISKEGTEFIEPIDTVKVDGHVLEIHYEDFSKSLAKGRSEFVIRKVRHLQNNNANCPLCTKRWSMAMECRGDKLFKKKLAKIIAIYSLFPENKDS